MSESLEKIKVELLPCGLKSLLKGAADILQTSIDIEGEAQIPGIGSVSAGEGEIGFFLTGSIGKIAAKAKDSPKLRSQFRQYFDPGTNNFKEALNLELLSPAGEQFKRLGKKGLVAIADNQGAGELLPQFYLSHPARIPVCQPGRAAEQTELPCGLYNSPGLDFLQ